MKQYTMKKEIFDRIECDVILRRKIADFKGITENSVMLSAKHNQSNYFYDVRIASIISEHLNIPFFGLFEEEGSETKKETIPSLKIDLINDRFRINNTRHNKLSEEEKSLLLKFVYYLKGAGMKGMYRTTKKLS